jgi:hypothetical protein
MKLKTPDSRTLCNINGRGQKCTQKKMFSENLKQEDILYDLGTNWKTISK